MKSDTVRSEGRAPTRRSGLLMLAALVAAAPARADPLRVTLATATPGGGFPDFGRAFSEAIRIADPDLDIVPRGSGGSAENVGLLQRSEADLALVQGAYAYPALGRPGGVTVLAPMYATPGLFVLRAESPVRTVGDLRGRAVALGTRDSGLTVLGRAVLSASGLDPDRDIRPILLDHAGDGPAMVSDGRAAALWGGGLGWPGFLAVARAAGGARFLGPPDQAMSALVAQDPALRRLTVPAGSFPGQDQPIATVGSWSLILARPGFPPEAAYRIVRALTRAGSALRSRHAQGGESDPRLLDGIVAPDTLNAGTARYLAEMKEGR
ncbi:TAXI family TRAP transporter solute-binding subunit [Methylobacterium sp. J-076]|uniref:TAXI family TRAP transporter solute-binding subunit n=1 Tax=Methylobacterium sp. J-076 TaxID=2836655 RepID=UPI001FBA1A69|nr:TAXI family TRAP transporter solute-binding subunit [Methylobacterium sp. J-076]MCJ2014437.1 TAXI family TRAP transporter solute-binding subunit [Methylobacterium sp. J-076]